MKLNSVINEAKKTTHPLLSGLLYTFATVFVGGLIIALILYFSSMSDAKIPIYSYIITAIALIVGGFVTGKRSGEKGWYYGGLTGLFYGIILLIITFLALDMSFNFRSLILIILTFLFGAFGGIFGVNSNK